MLTPFGFAYGWSMAEAVHADFKWERAEELRFFETRRLEERGAKAEKRRAYMADRRAEGLPARKPRRRRSRRREGAEVERPLR